ncbi:MAG TPA: folylpolyglutamate synthase/dihydrofolate synthase family protein [Caldisericia bacterium]|nr:folylpolyglutamate synthase/dihydrofolate synthase family protein [Caldisericia bacterium]HRV75572.1 folylpolyglutamate synthase/dihydrofolate synthase family protein [Caldisericia bacterium]
MNYCEALDYLGSIRYLGSKLGLDRLYPILSDLDDPHKAYPVVHIAGTKGKGSTSRMTSEILQASGYKVGLFTSPHLQSIRERAQVNDLIISTGEFSALIEEIRTLNIKHEKEFGTATFFEVITLLSFTHFLRQKVDCAVFEVGLGGRLDATNIIEKPACTVITSISHDHMKILGDTLGLIAKEKAGILKQGVPLVTAKQRKQAIDGIVEVATPLSVPINRESFDFDFTDRGPTDGGQLMDYSDKDGEITDIFVPMMGVHQLQNASLAIRACRILSKNGFDKVTPETIKAGLSKVFWPGRMESIKDGRLIILDGAHNGRSSDALARAINRHIKTPKRTLVVGMLKDKDTRRFIRALSTVSCKVIATSVDSPRSMNPEKLAKKFKQRCFDCEVVENPVDALIKAIDNTPDDGCVIVTGSLYLVASLRTALGRFNWNGI